MSDIRGPLALVVLASLGTACQSRRPDAAQTQAVWLEQRESVFAWIKEAKRADSVANAHWEAEARRVNREGTWEPALADALKKGDHLLANKILRRLNGEPEPPEPRLPSSWTMLINGSTLTCSAVGSLVQCF